jgi:hypothetical protein
MLQRGAHLLFMLPTTVPMQAAPVSLVCHKTNCSAWCLVCPLCSSVALLQGFCCQHIH